MKVSNSPDLSNEPKVVTLKETINELGSVINTENIHNPKKLLKLSKKIDRLYFSIENPNQRKIARNESLKLLSHIDIGTLQDASLAIDSSEYTSQISIVALVISILSIVRSVYPQNWFLLILIFPIVYILGILFNSFCIRKNTKLLEEFIKEVIAQQQNKTINTSDEIRKLKLLADDGIISQDEFEAKKDQLLGL